MPIRKGGSTLSKTAEMAKQLVDAEKARDWDKKDQLLEEHRVRLLMEREGDFIPIPLWLARVSD